MQPSICFQKNTNEVLSLTALSHLLTHTHTHTTPLGTSILMCRGGKWPQGPGLHSAKPEPSPWNWLTAYLKSPVRLNIWSFEFKAMQQLHYTPTCWIPTTPTEVTTQEQRVCYVLTV